MTNKERFDIRTMRYFIPQKNKYKTRITKADEQAMADLSSRGKGSRRGGMGGTGIPSKGLQNLMWGKTYRDEQITAYKRDISLGYITKYEIISSYPKDMQDWIAGKIKDVPYDTEGQTSKALVSMYRRGDY